MVFNFSRHLLSSCDIKEWDIVCIHEIWAENSVPIILISGVFNQGEGNKTFRPSQTKSLHTDSRNWIKKKIDYRYVPAWTFQHSPGSWNTATGCNKSTHKLCICPTSNNSAKFIAVVLKPTLTHLILLNAPCPRWTLHLTVHFIEIDVQIEELKLIRLKNAKLGHPQLFMSQCTTASDCCFAVIWLVLNHFQKLCAWCKYRHVLIFFGSLSGNIVGSNQYDFKWQQTQCEKQLQAIQPIQSCYSPLKAPPSTSTGQYRPWQQIPESNLELNRLLN